MQNQPLWQKLQELPRSDWPQYIKRNHPDLWLKFAWQKVDLWRDGQKEQAKILGDTPDYSRQLFTLDDRANRMVNYAFQKYWEDDLIYKGAYLVNWSVGLQTAVSDVSGEIEYEKRVDPFVTFEYRLDISNSKIPAKFEDLKNYFLANPILVSTVRPETIFGDVAILMNEKVLSQKLESARFEKDVIDELLEDLVVGTAIGDVVFNFEISGMVQKVKLILGNDDEVDPNFGTGALKITPASDQHDYQIFNKYIGGNFPHAIGRDGKLTEACGEFTGLTVEQGRLAVIKRLAETGYIPVKEECLRVEDQDTLRPADTSLVRETLRMKILAEVKNNLESESFDATVYSYEEGQKRLQEMLGEAGKKLEINWDYEHNVSICERSKTVIEPLISEEFFLNYQATAKSTGKTLQQHGFEGVNEIQFFSEDYKDRANNFLKEINNWCISRDLLWGHKIPVWYNLDLNPERKFYSKQEIYGWGSPANRTDGQKLDSDHPYNQMRICADKPTDPGNWVQEKKIFDTWFSSTLWPLSTLDFYDYQKNKPKVVIIHGGNSAQNEGELEEMLQEYELNLSQNWNSWKSDIAEKLQLDGYEVYYPEMPNKLNAEYSHWKIWFEKLLKKLNSLENLILVGHSLGGNFLLKYLSEHKLPILGLFLVAACNNQRGGFGLTSDLNLIKESTKNVFIFHSKDDNVVDFCEAETFHQQIEGSELIDFNDKGHFNQPVFLRLEVEIRNLVNKNKPKPTDFEKFYPTTEMVTAKEIFYIWVVRMIVLGKYFTGKIPFKKIVIHPTILDEKGRKMSKSLGNGLDPVDAINKFSSDSLRMAMLSGMIPNRNMKMGGGLADTLMEKYRNFGNKLWNVARFLENSEKKKD